MVVAQGPTVGVTSFSASRGRTNLKGGRAEVPSIRFLLAILLALVAAPAALAQDAERTATLLASDFEYLVVPEFKFTQIGNDDSILAGAYGGWLINRNYLVGGSWYQLVSGSDGDEMSYGGGVFEYFVNERSLVNVSGRILIGGGSATLAMGIESAVDIPDAMNEGGSEGSEDEANGASSELKIPDGPDRASSVSFFVAEPEVNLIVNISERFRLSVGAGYRLIGGAAGFRKSLDGFAGSLALKLRF